jgi:hypothetical protein
MSKVVRVVGLVPRDSPRIAATGCALDAAGRLVMAAHGVDCGDGVVAVDLDLD